MPDAEGRVLAVGPSLVNPDAPVAPMSDAERARLAVAENAGLTEQIALMTDRVNAAELAAAAAAQSFADLGAAYERLRAEAEKLCAVLDDGSFDPEGQLMTLVETIRAFGPAPEPDFNVAASEPMPEPAEGVQP